MLDASMIWEKPRINAENPTPEQDRGAYRQRPLPAAAAGRCNPSGIADGTRTVLLTTTSTSSLPVLDAGHDRSTRPEYLVTRTPF
jgi:hypothetical protein